MCYDLMMIKEKYGERMMHLCRKLFPTILEKEGLLFKLLSDNFAYSRFLYDDIVNNMMEGRFKDYIYSLLNNIDEEIYLCDEVLKTPTELLSKVGYDLYECKSEEEIQSFKKYYHQREFLCTFKGNRLDTCYVFFAVKKNVDEIKREDFITPLRQDAYGTSVISIQFTKGDVNTLSIKNRYNHIVRNPDATFSNNLENIVPGLTKSFERTYGLKINQNNFGEFEMPGYVKANDGKFYKYNYEINNVYYCPNNIIIHDFNVIDTYREKEKYIVMDYFIVDLVEKKIYLYDFLIYDSFIFTLPNIKNIHINRNRDTKNKSLYITFEDGTDAIIEIDKLNRIVSYTNKNITDIDDNFLMFNKYLKNIDIPNVLKIGCNFLYNNLSLSSIELLNVLKIGDNFIRDNRIIEDVILPKLISVGDNFLIFNSDVEKIDLPNLECAGKYFLAHNRILNEINASNLAFVDGWFLYYNLGLKKIDLPNLECCGDHFITANNDISDFSLPKLVQVGDNFLWRNKQLTAIDMPKLTTVGRNFVYANSKINFVNLPSVVDIGNCFLYSNDALEYLDMPNVINIGSNFMFNNNELISLFMGRLTSVGNDFLRSNVVLREFDLSSLEHYGRDFLRINDNGRKRILEKYCN